LFARYLRDELRVTRYLRLLRTPVDLSLFRAGSVHVLELRSRGSNETSTVVRGPR